MFKWILTFTNEENIDQPMINQFSEIAQRYISSTFDLKAYIDRGQHKSYTFWQWTFSFLFSPLCTYFFFFSISQWCSNVFFFLAGGGGGYFVFGQTTSKSVTVNHIQSFSINIPHRVVCTFVLFKWIYGINKKCSLLHFSTVTVIQTVVIVYIR